MIKQVQQLNKGDVMRGSGETVIGIAVAGVGIPSNKARVYLDKNGNKRSTLWGKYTRVSVVDTNELK